MIPAPVADPLEPSSSISATVSLPLPGIVDVGVLSTAPPQALAIAAEALGPAPASVATGFWRYFAAFAQPGLQASFLQVQSGPSRSNPTQQEQQQRQPSAVCPAILSCAFLAGTHCYAGVSQCG